MLRTTAIVLLALVRGAPLPGQPEAPALPCVRTGEAALLLGVWFTGREEGVVVGGQGERGERALIRHTRDGGRSWTTVSADLGERLYDLHFPTPSVGWAAGLGGTVVRTTDGGRAWERVGKDAIRGWIAALWFTGAGTGFLAGSDEGRMLLLETRDGGRRWISRREALPEAVRDRPLRDVVFRDARHGMAVGEGGLVIATEDGGRSWSVVPTPVESRLRSVTLPAEGCALVTSARGEVLRTDDGGATWRVLAVPERDKLNSIAFRTKARGMLSTMSGALWETRDGGATWTCRHRHGEHLTAIALAPGATWIAGGDGRLVRAAE